MKKGLSFQSKLMLTLVAAIAVASFAIIVVTENKVSQAYTKQFSRDFRRLVTQLERSRDERSQEFMELSRRLATHPYVLSALLGDKDQETAFEFWRYYLSSLDELEGKTEKRPEPGGPRPLPSDLVNRLGSVGIVHPNGEIESLPPPPLNGNRENGRRAQLAAKLRQSPAWLERARKQIEELLAQGEQRTLFLPFETPDGSGFVQEMVSTPVKSPETGAIVGLFLRAASAETEAQRFLERYQEEFSSETPLLTGIYLDGQVYSRALNPKTAMGMAEVISAQITSASPMKGSRHLAFEASLQGEPYRFYATPLSQDTGFPTAYQVSAFSLAPLKADLAELRLRGSGVGASALALGIAIAWLFSRRLSVPIAELTRASRAVRDGRLDTRIEVRTHDEIGELAESFNEMTDGLRQRDAYRSILGKVSDETVAQAMISGDLDLELGGELKTVTVLFCDIRGFTGKTEHMPPTEVIGMLNDHMTAMTAIVRKHFGVVDKFVGDEIMAVFGALKSYGSDSAHAVACAIEMIEERDRLNLTSIHPVEIGIGVATGEAVAGCMGSVDRLNYTVIGARVNLASRLCTEAGSMEVVIDEATLSSLDPNRVESEALADLKLKGFSETVTAYRVRTVDSANGEVRENFDLVRNDG
ncbi:MAG: HAMP domain-containing protein [Verrucomicrobiae bacterium]|nr:HAMP domain-containing protein [Verrucomicrobiae bacterium]